MRPDPEPDDTVIGINTQRAIVLIDARAPVAADLLEMQRMMPVILFEELEAPVRQLPDFSGSASRHCQNLLLARWAMDAAYRMARSTNHSG